MFPCNILLSKLQIYGFDKWTVIDEEMVERLFPESEVMSVVSQESVLKQMLFNIFISDAGGWIKCALSKFVSDI